MISWFTGLGIAAKLAVGFAVAAVAAVTGIGAASAIGGFVSEEMPVPTIESTLEPTPEPTGEFDDNAYDPDEYDSFGEWVSERAHDKDGTGREFGKEISEAAHDKSGDGSESEDESEDGAEDESVDDLDDESEDSGGSNKPEGAGKSDH